MPVKQCTSNGRSGFKWGDAGKCYTYSQGDTSGMNKAKQKAHLQGAAITGGTMREDWDTNKLDEHDKHFEVTEAEKATRNKPGGSNAGNYKGVTQFCGPSGGAPAGTYPVNTRKRAIAALAYAHNASNPSGIKSCVCRHYPGLDACKKKNTEHFYFRGE